MAIEQDKTLEALQFAIRMEIDGKEYYLTISEETSTAAGKSLLQSLAAAEDFHRQKFVEIYEVLRGRQSWPVIILQSPSAGELRTVFSRAAEELSSNVKPLATELVAIEKAMEMENRSYDYYKSQETEAEHDVERDFYKNLAAEERVHQLALLDYYEYLKDPAGWFVRTEHPSLDGG